MDTTGMLMDVKRFAVHDGPGIRTTLFLKGCPLRCVWCHNPEGIAFKPQVAYYEHKCIGCGECARACAQGAHKLSETSHRYLRESCNACGACEEVCLGEAMKLYGRAVTVEEAAALALEDVDFYGETGGVTVSGGEPLLQAAFVAVFLAGMKARGVLTAVDTCGCVPWEAFSKVLPHADLFLYDVKHMDPRRHKELTGAGNALILENLRRLSDAGKHIEIRIPLVPGCNDDPRTLEQMGAFLGGLRVEKVRVLPYHALARAKYRALGLNDTMPEVAPPTDAGLDRAVERLRQYGLDAVSGRA